VIDDASRLGAEIACNQPQRSLSDRGSVVVFKLLAGNLIQRVQIEHWRVFPSCASTLFEAVLPDLARRRCDTSGFNQD
jgi:hypothetical protein